MESTEEPVDGTARTIGSGSDRGGRRRDRRPRRGGCRGPPDRSGRSDRSNHSGRSGPSGPRSSKRAIRVLSIAVPVGILSVVGTRVGAYGRRMASEPGGGSGGVPPVDAADLSAAASAVHVASLGAGTLAAFVIGAFVLLMTIRVAARLSR